MSSPGGTLKNFEHLLELPNKAIRQFLLNVKPVDLANVCSSNSKIAEICGSDKFIRLYIKKHKEDIEERRATIIEGEGDFFGHVYDNLGQSLYKAVEKGNLDFYKKWQHYANWTNGSRTWALKAASENGHYDMVKYLLKEGRADPSDEESYCLRYAAYNGHYKIVVALLEDGRANINDIFKYPDPPLNLERLGIEVPEDLNEKFKEIDPKVLKLVLENDRVRQKFINRYLAYVCEHGHVETLKTMLKSSSVDPTYNYNCSIRYAASNGHAPVVKLLLEDKRADPSAEDNDSIKSASENDHASVVKLLLEDERVDPLVGDEAILLWDDVDVESNGPLILACSSGSENAVRVLLEDLRVDPASEENLAIKAAAFGGYDKIVSMLLNDPFERGVDPSDDENFALQMAVEYNHIEVVNLLLKDKRVEDTIDIKFLKSLAKLAQKSQLLAMVKLIKDYIKLNLSEEGPKVKLETIKMSIKDIPEVMDVMYRNTPTAEEWLAEDKDNIIFIHEGQPSGFDKSSLRTLIGIDDENYYFECKEKNKGLAVSLKNIYEDRPYINIGLPTVQFQYNYYITLPEAEALFESKARVFTFKKTDKILKYTASNTSVQRGAGMNYRGEQVNVASGDHCQDMSNKETYTLYEVELTD